MSPAERIAQKTEYALLPIYDRYGMRDLLSKMGMRPRGTGVEMSLEEDDMVVLMDATHGLTQPGCVRVRGCYASGVHMNVHGRPASQAEEVVMAQRFEQAIDVLYQTLQSRVGARF